MLSRLLSSLMVLTLAVLVSPAAGQYSPLAPAQPAPVQPAAGPEPLTPPESSRHQVWFVLKPDGLRFVQSPEELKSIQQSPPENAFVIACHEFEMKGTPGEGSPRYVLECRHAAVVGRYGTEKWVSIEGQTLRYDTQGRELQLTGSDEEPVQFSVEGDGDEMKVTTSGIQLHLGASSYQMQAIGVQMEFFAEPAAPIQPAAYPSPTPYAPQAPVYSLPPAASPYTDPVSPDSVPADTPSSPPRS